VTPDPELVDQMAAGDAGAFLVFADWLQQQGHPLGEIIALERGGKGARAEDLIKKHRKALVGAFKPSRAVLGGAFLEQASVGDLDELKALIALPSSVLLKELRLLLNASAAELELASRAFRHLHRLFLWMPRSSFEPLVMPRLVRLTLWIDEPELDGKLDLLLAARGLAGVRELEILGDGRKSKSMPLPLVEKLFASPLVRQLERLSINQGKLLGKKHTGVFVREAQGRLGGLEAIDLDSWLTEVPEIKTGFGGRLRRWQR
jgi:uncharacterized protein (TIGR02996 family)